VSDNPYAAPAEDPISMHAAGELGTSPYGPYRDLGLISKLVIGVFLTGAFISGGRIYAIMSYNEAFTRFFEDLQTADEVDRWAEIESQLHTASLVTLAASIILWCMWKNMSCKNAWLFRSARPPTRLDRITSLQNLQSSAETFTPGWAVGWYFIPFANLWKPYQAMSFIRNEVAEQFRGGNLVGLWWLSYVVMNIGSAFLNRKSDYSDTINAIHHQNQNLVIAHGLTIAATIFAVSVVIVLTRAQKEKARALGAI
jgi:hypothetical protein